MRVYSDEAALAAGNHSTQFTPQCGTHGTYFAVNNGVIYSRAAANDNGSVRKWDSTTGNAIGGNVNGSFAVIPNLGGDNGSQLGGNRFDWGGFAAVNWMQDQTGLYVFAKH